MNSLDITRRTALARSGGWVVNAAVVLVAAQSRTAIAGKATKADFFYQDKPKDGKSCATCRLYAVTESGKGACAVIDGEVSPTGWCLAHSPRG
jgi:High potential iron-sulfur protein